MQDKTKIVIADDHSVTLNGIKQIVEKIDFTEIVGTASNGKEALKILRMEKLPVLDYDNLLENLEIDISYNFDNNEEKGLVIPSIEIYSEIKKEISLLKEDNLEKYVKKCCNLINSIIKS